MSTRADAGAAGGGGIRPVDPESIDVGWVRARYAQAHEQIRANILPSIHCRGRVLTTAPFFGKQMYAEISALESLLYAKHDPDVAVATHEAFFNCQREDGQIPAVLDEAPRKEWGGASLSFGHIQQNVPFARTAWELARQTKREDFLARAYTCCAKFDRWVARHRDTRKTGLVEMFCEYDMGLDYSPRCHGNGIPRFCPGFDATKYLDVQGFPLIAPDLSAVIYGGRVALAAMAEALDRPSEAAVWRERAEALRAGIVMHCFDPRDEFFYDVNKDGSSRRIRGTQLFSVFQEHVVDAAMFERIYRRYVRNPAEYWATVPFPSVSMADPHFDPKPVSDWSGSSIVSIPARALLWMPHYGKQADLETVMRRWIAAWSQNDKLETILHPVTGRGYPNCIWADMTSTLIQFTEFVDQLGLLESRPDG